MREKFGIIGTFSLENGDVGAGGMSAWPNIACPDKATNPEKYRVSRIRGIEETEDPTKNNDYGRIARWMSDVETRRHIRAPISPIENFADNKATEEALKELDRYYHNKNRRDENGNIIDDDPRKIIPIVAVNGCGEAIATLVIRLKGDPFEKDSKEIKEEGKIKSGNGNDQEKVRKISRVPYGIESVVVDPDLQGKHVGTQLMISALHLIFNRKGYDGRSANAVRLWVFQDDKAGNWTRNVKFVRSLGFDVIGTDKGGTWKEYAAKRGIPNPDKRDGQQYELTKKKWEETVMEDAKTEHPKLMLFPDIIDEATLRISHTPVEDTIVNHDSKAS